MDTRPDRHRRRWPTAAAPEAAEVLNPVALRRAVRHRAGPCRATRPVRPPRRLELRTGFLPEALPERKLQPFPARRPSWLSEQARWLRASHLPYRAEAMDHPPPPARTKWTGQPVDRAGALTFLPEAGLFPHGVFEQINRRTTITYKGNRCILAAPADIILVANTAGKPMLTSESTVRFRRTIGASADGMVACAKMALVSGGCRWTTAASTR
jgi:hypothetical protein